VTGIDPATSKLTWRYRKLFLYLIDTAIERGTDINDPDPFMNRIREELVNVKDELLTLGHPWPPRPWVYMYKHRIW